MKVTTLFTPDYVRYDGVRPIQAHLLRVGYVLVVVFVGFRTWAGIFHHQGDWEPYMAAAVSMWASSSLLSVLGVLHPLRMLPIVLFEIGYKTLWLVVVAWPLWTANRLTGSPAEELTYAFLPVIVPILLVPWSYVFRRYIRRTSTRTAAREVAFD
jgi:hypothetical protein